MIRSYILTSAPIASQRAQSARVARQPVKRDYDYETVRVGVVRPSMRTNHALLASMEAPIGRAVTIQSPQALKLTHGVKNVYDGGASEGLSAIL